MECMKYLGAALPTSVRAFAKGGAALALLWCGSTVAGAAGPCTAAWMETGGELGVNNAVTALTVFDDGDGEALYVGGLFTFAGGVNASRIARWDGTSWSPLGSGLVGQVGALVTFDDGGGNALYAGGFFTTAGGQNASRIAKWDGATWSPLGTGVNNGVRAMVVFDDGSGPALFVAGQFTQAGGAAASRIAKWDGAAWSPLGTGLSGFAHALAVYDDGSGPALYVGGSFTHAGGVEVNGIAKWNGASWSGVGGGLSGSLFAEVWSFGVHDDGSGPALYVGGVFDMAGGISAENIAKWDGSSWSSLGPGTSSRVDAIMFFDDGTGGGSALYVGASVSAVGASGIAKWNGAAWSSLESGMNLGANALAAFDDQSGLGPALYVGGDFTFSATDDQYFARWQGCPIEPICEPADLNCDQIVDVFDLLDLLTSWGPCVKDCPPACYGDINEDCIVDVFDMIVLLDNFG